VVAKLGFRVAAAKLAALAVLLLSAVATQAASSPEAPSCRTVRTILRQGPGISTLTPKDLARCGLSPAGVDACDSMPPGPVADACWLRRASVAASVAKDKDLPDTGGIPYERR